MTIRLGAWQLLFDKLNSRKFMAAVFAMSVSSALVWFGKIPTESWTIVVTTSICAYIAAQWNIDKSVYNNPNDRDPM